MRVDYYMESHEFSSAYYENSLIASDFYHKNARYVDFDWDGDQMNKTFHLNYSQLPKIEASFGMEFFVIYDPLFLNSKDLYQSSMNYYLFLTLNVIKKNYSYQSYFKLEKV